MKRIILLASLFLLLVSSGSLLFSKGDVEFNRGIVYLLINDNALAKKHLTVFFNQNPTHSSLKSGYNLLLQGKNSEATTQFQTYININHRSTVAITGVALSTAERKITNTVELLQRSIQLNPRYAPGYMALGMEYLKKKNYPVAERYLKRGYAYSRIPESKILLGMLYLETGTPATTLNLLKGEADRTKENFYFNFLTAKAYLQMDKILEMGPYLQAALQINPDDKEGKILMARYHLTNNDPQRAKFVLKGVKFDEYNEDYVKTMGHVLLKLKAKNAKQYLYEVFKRNPWDRDINELLGLYHLWLMENSNVQHWINRATLCGSDLEKLKEKFTEKYKYPEYITLPLFDVRDIAWINEELLLVSGVRSSGNPEQIFVIDLNKMRVIKSFTYRGTFQNFFLSEERNHVIFSTSVQLGKKTYLYAISFRGQNADIKQVFHNPLNMPSILAGFNDGGSLAYITDSRIDPKAFESPFSFERKAGVPMKLYPDYPLPIYIYNFSTRRFLELKDRSELGKVPIDAVKKYALVAETIFSQPAVQSLIEKGEQLDITADEMVKVYFSSDMSSFIIYLSDLKNACKGVICDNINNKVTEINADLFLGKGNFSEIKFLDFDPRKHQLILMTKDDKKELMIYNYKSRLATYLTSNTYKYHYNKADNMIYLLTLLSADGIFPPTSLRSISLHPFLNKSAGPQRDFNDIISSDSLSSVNVSTYDGEIIQIDYDNKSTYIKPALEGCVHKVAPSGKRRAAFINGKLIITGMEPPKRNNK